MATAVRSHSASKTATGLRTAHVLLAGHIEDFAFAVRAQDSRNRHAQVHAGCWESGGPDQFYGHFGTLDAQIQEMFLNGQAPVAIERTLLTTKMLAAAMHGLALPGQRINTPQLAIAYQPA